MIQAIATICLKNNARIRLHVLSAKHKQTSLRLQATGKVWVRSLVSPFQKPPELFCKTFAKQA